MFLFDRAMYHSRSSPRGHYRKQPVLVTTTFVKLRLNCALNFLIKGSRKRPLPQETATTFGITQLHFSFVFKLS